MKTTSEATWSPEETELRKLAELQLEYLETRMIDWKRKEERLERELGEFRAEMYKLQLAIHGLGGYLVAHTATEVPL